MTGCTAIQIDSQNRTIQKIDVPSSIVEALRSSGHEVEWRKVDPGEDLDSFDVIWCNMAPINSLNGRAGAMGALWALSSGKPCVAFFDDWQFPAVYNGMRALWRKPTMLTKYMLVGAAHRGDEAATYFTRDEVYAARARLIAANPDAEKKTYIDRYYYKDTDEGVLPYKDRLIETARAFDHALWERGMVPVVPMYSWGDRSLVRKRMPKEMGPIEPLDPSSTIYPLIAPFSPLPSEEKKRTWMLGALMPHDDWLAKKDFDWPITFMGAKNVVKKHGGERVKTEAEVIDRYNKVWGILSPPYPHAGCGWWRSRFIYAAKIGSVLVCDRGEGDPLGSPYKVRMREVEAMSDSELTELAAAQAAALRPYMPTPDSFVEHVNHIIDRAQRESKGWTYDG